MAVTVAELATIVDSTVVICVTDEGTGAMSLAIEGLQIRVGSGPELKDATGFGVDAAAARADYVVKVKGQVVVVGGNVKGLEIRVPTTLAV